MKSIAVIAAASVLLAPGVSLAQKSGAKPDFTLDPNYGSVRLETGFTPDPWTKSILAGGSIAASATIRASVAVATHPVVRTSAATVRTRPLRTRRARVSAASPQIIPPV